MHIKNLSRNDYKAWFIRNAAKIDPQRKRFMSPAEKCFRAFKDTTINTKHMNSEHHNRKIYTNVELHATTPRLFQEAIN